MMNKLVMITFLIGLTLVNCGGNSGEVEAPKPEATAEPTAVEQAQQEEFIVSPEEIAAYEAEELLPLKPLLPMEESYIQEMTQEQIMYAARESGEYIDPQVVMDLLRSEAGTAIAEKTIIELPAVPQDKTWRISYDSYNAGRSRFEKGEFAEAAVLWTTIATDSPAYTLSVEVDCDTTLLIESYLQLSKLEMPIFIKKANVNGRDCFRLCAGVFANENAAREMVGQVVAAKEGTYPFPHLLR
jgi:hypothetical protein